MRLEILIATSNLWFQSKHLEFTFVEELMIKVGWADRICKSELAVCNVLVRPKNHAFDGGSYPIHATWSGQERREELHGDDTPAEKIPECSNPSGCGRGGLTFSDVAKGSCGSVKCRHWKRWDQLAWLRIREYSGTIVAYQLWKSLLECSNN